MLDKTQDGDWPGVKGEHIPAEKWVKAINTQLAESPGEPMTFEVFKDGIAVLEIVKAIEHIHKTNPLIEFAITYRI